MAVFDGGVFDSGVFDVGAEIVLSPSAAVVVLVVPVPSLALSIILSPDPVALLLAVPAPTVSGAGDVVLTPIPVATAAEVTTGAVLEQGEAPPSPEPLPPGIPQDATITASDRGAGGGTRAVSRTLFQHYAGFYGCDPGTYEYEEGALLVGWDTDGDNPPMGWFGEPSSGPIDLEPYPGGAAVACTFRGLRVTASSRIDIHHSGHGLGVAFGNAGDPAYYIIQLRQNGTVIEEYAKYDTNYEGLHTFGIIPGTVIFDIVGVVAAAGDLFEVSVIMGGSWAGFQYYATIPADRNGESHFRISGDTLPGRPFLRASVVTATPS